PLLFVLTLLSMVLLASCAVIRPSAPEINLASIKVTDLTLTNAELIAGLKVYNPNDATITIKEVDYELAIGGIRVSRGESIKRIRIGAFETGQVDMRLSSNYLDIIRVLNKVQNGSDMDFVIEGKVKYEVFGFSNLTYRFKKKGTLPVSSPIQN
ncbi:MAG: LEA type 2 family protein, partial [Dissulfurimicrobium sp.]